MWKWKWAGCFPHGQVTGRLRVLGGGGEGDGAWWDRQVLRQANGRVGEGWLRNWTNACFREERKGRERQRLTQAEEIGART